ncbi:MAG: nitrile hydratase subunit beta [Rhodospirillales bacterium]|nr:nitrile hydratase subunit beta [Rhodospirillales bacterium]
MSGPRFAPGDRVTVVRRYPRHHHRAPDYIKGRTGVVERICGTFGNPETLGHGGDGKPDQPLYRVRFTMGHLWGTRAEVAADTVEVEVYENWLEQAS